MKRRHIKKEGIEMHAFGNALSFLMGVVVSTGFWWVALGPVGRGCVKLLGGL